MEENKTKHPKREVNKHDISVKETSEPIIKIVRYDPTDQSELAAFLDEKKQTTKKLKR